MKLIKEAKRWQKLAGIKEQEGDDLGPNPPIDPEPGQENPEPEPEPEPAEEPETPSGPISRQEAKQLIKGSKGKFFTVTFTKKDGTTRVMNARLGVKAYLKGGELPYDPEEKGLIPVYSIDSKGYRMININTITNLKINNKDYRVS